MRGGEAYARGVSSGHGRIQLGDLDAGRYVLRVQGKATPIVVGD
jgi:hypothetical protein